MWAWGLFYRNMIFHEITYITYTMSHYIVILYYIVVVELKWTMGFIRVVYDIKYNERIIMDQLRICDKICTICILGSILYIIVLGQL